MEVSVREVNGRYPAGQVSDGNPGMKVPERELSVLLVGQDFQPELLEPKVGHQHYTMPCANVAGGDGRWAWPGENCRASVQ